MTQDATDPNRPAGDGVAPAGSTEPVVIGVRTGSFGASGSGDTSGFGHLVQRIEWPAPAARPYGGWFDEVTDELEAVLADHGLPLTAAVARVVIQHGEITYHVRREHLLPVMQSLRDEPSLRFEYLSGVSGVHYPNDTGAELHAVYHLASFTHNRRVRVETTCPDSDASVPSVVALYPNADWHERETYDFFGIVFSGHPHLTRIEMPDDWLGHPQRKDYPLGGIPVEYKGATVPPPDQRRSYN